MKYDSLNKRLRRAWDQTGFFSEKLFSHRGEFIKPVQNKKICFPPKAAELEGRFREIVSDPINLLIQRVPMAGYICGDLVQLHNGLKVPLTGPHAYSGDFSRILVLNRGVHEPLEEFVFQEVLNLLPESPLMIELGAYWAHYSMWLKLIRPKATTIMVEPEVEYLDVGRRNFKFNGFDGEFIQDFVETGKFEVDTFTNLRNIKHVAILHADIQGYEKYLLTGARRLLHMQAIDHIFISTHSQELHKSAAAELEHAEYRVEVSSDFDFETTSHDGFIYASSSKLPSTFLNFQSVGRTEIANMSPRDLLRYLSSIKTRAPL